MQPDRLITHSVAALTLSLACLAVLCGCGKRLDKWERLRPPVYPAGGRVLVDGQPDAGVLVMFESSEHPLVASGLCDSSGAFTLQTFGPGDGAVGGGHRVRIEKWVNKDPQAAAPVEVNVLPEIYSIPEKSGLTAAVDPKSRNQFEFDLQTKGKRR